MKKFKLILGVTAFAKTMALLAIMAVLAVKKKSIPKALIAILGITSVSSALLLISYDKDVKNLRQMKQRDAFYDYESDYYNDFDGEDDDCEEDELAF